jgi:hypothetical protein
LIGGFQPTCVDVNNNVDKDDIHFAIKYKNRKRNELSEDDSSSEIEEDESSFTGDEDEDNTESHGTSAGLIIAYILIALAILGTLGALIYLIVVLVRRGKDERRAPRKQGSVTF